jgi:hypothetical protein
VTLADADLDVDLQAPEVSVPRMGIDALFDDLKARFPDVDLDASIERLKAKLPGLDLKTALQGLKVDFPDLDLDGAFGSLKAKFPHLDLEADIGDLTTDLPERWAGAVPSTHEERDNLKRIEGIGPKIAQLLQHNGIQTFAQLADTRVDRLLAILQAGGPNFGLADPTTWPEQAKLAADGAWDQLQALQERLIGGRKTRQWKR